MKNYLIKIKATIKAENATRAQDKIRLLIPLIEQITVNGNSNQIRIENTTVLIEVP